MCFDFNFRTVINDVYHAAFLHMYVCFHKRTVYEVLDTKSCCVSERIEFAWISVSGYVDVFASLCLIPCLGLSVHAGI